MNLSIEKLYKQYDKTIVLDNVNINVSNVKSLVLIGPSGGGKTTLLKIIGGLEQMSGGSIILNNHILTKNEKEMFSYRKKIGVVFQAYNLFPHLTAIENIMLPLTKVFKNEKEEAHNTASKLLKRFNLIGHADKKPSNLSGGQQQRIALCRAVAVNPEILLLDEPTSSLDPEYTAEVLDLILELKEEGMDIILATHEMGFAKEISDYVFFVSDKKISVHGSPQEIFGKENKDERLKSFLDKVLRHN